jgi:hypothetical protein
MTFTFNEDGESGFNTKSVPLRKEASHAKGTGESVGVRMHTSCKGEKKYNVCGVEDLRKCAIRPYTKADKPPSARLCYENDRSELRPFMRNSAPTPQQHPSRAKSSNDMWGILRWAGGRHETPMQTTTTLAFDEFTPSETGFREDGITPSEFDSEVFQDQTMRRCSSAPSQSSRSRTGTNQSSVSGTGQLTRRKATPFERRSGSSTGPSSPAWRI